jgi:hypothetical protein
MAAVACRETWRPSPTLTSLISNLLKFTQISDMKTNRKSCIYIFLYIFIYIQLRIFMGCGDLLTLMNQPAVALQISVGKNSGVVKIKIKFAARPDLHRKTGCRWPVSRNISVPWPWICTGMHSTRRLMAWSFNPQEDVVPVGSLCGCGCWTTTTMGSLKPLS